MKYWLFLSAACASLAAAAETYAFTHMADASAGEWLGKGFFVAASDEDNLLRVYRLPQGGPPVFNWDPTPYVRLDSKSPEMDIEGSAKVGEIIYWITSHAPNREGKPRPNRKRFFATRVSANDGHPSVAFVGQPVATLMEDLARDARYTRFDLAAAALLPPKTPGSLNIEALCDTPDGGLLIGFRSPVPQGLALLVPLANPAEVVSGRPPFFGDPLLVDLGGNGFRAMARVGDVYRIISGSPLAGGRPRVYRWDGRGKPEPDPLPDLPADVTPEGLVAAEIGGRAALLVLSDDGARLVDGRPAKNHQDPARRTFRAFQLSKEP